MNRARLAAAARVATLVAVTGMFAVLVYRLVQPDAGAVLTRAVRHHQAPVAPNVRLRVVWRNAATWPTGLRTLAARTTLTLGDLRGYPVVVNFWASWCGPCKREASLLASAAAARRGRAVFIGVDVNDPGDGATAFLRSHAVPYVIVRSGSSVIERFGLIGLPETFYLDRTGHVRGYTRGEISTATLERGLAGST